MISTDQPADVELADCTLRALTDDGSFRTITASTTETVRGALASQNLIGQKAHIFADLLTGAILIRETMAPGLRVQVIFKQPAERISIIADSHPSGDTRGLVIGDSAQLGKSRALLQVMRSLPNGSIHQGVVEVPESGRVSDALMMYMETSEQVSTMMAVDSVFSEDEQLVAAGGYLVQLLPEVGRAPLAVMGERLKDFKSIAELLSNPAFTPRWLIAELLYLMPFTEVEEGSVRFGCWCSRTAVLGALATIDRGEIRDMVEEGNVLEITCDYCREDYRIVPAELRGLLGDS